MTSDFSLQDSSGATATAPQSTWIVRNRRRHAQFRLFCFHCAGGSAGQFRLWDALAPAQIEIACVQLPGRDTRYREPQMRDIHLLTELMTSTLAPYFDIPFAFFGHSLGALIALEFARRLRHGGLSTPRHLFVASRPAPHLPLESFPVDQLPDAALLRVLRVYGGISETLLTDESVMRWFLPTIRADFEMARTYTYEHDDPLPCPITALVGDSDPHCSPSQMQEWQEQTSAQFRFDCLPGNHFFIREHSRKIVALIAEHLLRP